MKTCQYCGKEFQQSQQLKKYCAECSTMNRDIRRGKVFNSDNVQICEYCKIEFKHIRKRRFCSDECLKQSTSNFYKNKRDNETKKEVICEQCGEKFKTKTNVKKCRKCSCLNGLEKIKIANEIRKQTKVKKICKWCGKEYEATLLNTNQEYCSKTCQNKVHHKIRRARKINAFVESVKLLQVYKNDKGKCAICGVKVDLSLKHPHPQSASIDHVVPLSLGGTHEYKNVQLTHLKCNLSKGIKAMNEQLKLL